MATYTRTGSFLLAGQLAKDPFGTIHRAVVTTGAAFERHMLVRTFSDEIVQAGINTRLADVMKAAQVLGGSRAYGQGYRTEAGKVPVVACEFVPGRSLAQLIEKARLEQIPFGVDHALSVIQGVAQSVVQMHGKGLTHGVLSPHSVWVSFEGATQLLDAPYAASMAALAPKSVTVQTILSPYFQGGDQPLTRDLFGIGAILFELLTFEKLPVGLDAVGAALNRATLKAAQEEAPLPAEIKAFLGRLLLGTSPFTNMESFNQELERVLYDGDFSPTTFSLAFFMHTLFREENDKDTAAVKAEQSENYTGYTAVGEAMRSGAGRAEHIDTLQEEQEKSKKQVVIGGIAAAALLLLGGVYFMGRNRENPEMAALRQQLADLQRQQALQEQAKMDLQMKQQAESAKEQKLQEQLSQAKSATEKEAVQKQLEESKKQKAELERQAKELADRQKQIQAAQQVAAAKAQQAIDTPKQAAAQPPAPQQAAQNPPAPAANNPAPAQTPSAAPAPLPQAPQQVPENKPSAPAVEVPPAMVNQVVPVFPQRALLQKWELTKEHNVRLRIFVNEAGQALTVKVIEGVPGSFGFDEAAIDAAKQSTYQPATRDGKPVKAWTEVYFRFPRRR
ncbi:MAG TPA: energy transducer TonB [Holophagaceae bacterium]|nr:energy transducer TonB [Holophagaceae bacterium]